MGWLASLALTFFVMTFATWQCFAMGIIFEKYNRASATGLRLTMFVRRRMWVTDYEQNENVQPLSREMGGRLHYFMLSC